jgi:capsid protein
MGVRDRLSRAIGELRGVSQEPGPAPRETRSAPRDVAIVPRTPMPTRRSLRSHYRAAAFTRTTSDWRPSLESPDDIVRADIRALRGRAREMDQSDPLIGMYGEQLIANVLGAGGMEHKAQVLVPGTTELAEEVNKTIDAAWDD